MPQKRRPKIDANALKAFRRAQASAPAPASKPKSKTNLGKTAQGGGAKRKPEITEADVKGFKYFALINPLLKGLHDCATKRDVAGNRILHYDQYCSLVLLFYFNPIVDSLRGIQQASQLGKI